MNLGLVAFKTNRFGDARDMFEECRSILDGLGDRSLLPHLLANLGITLIQLQDEAGARAAYRAALGVSVESGNLETMAASIEGFAQLAQQTDGERSIRLCAAADAIRTEAGTPRVPSDQPEWNANLERAEREFGKDRFAELWQEGIALGRDGAVTYALNEEADPKG
jgi:hypothetical protein